METTTWQAERRQWERAWRRADQALPTLFQYMRDMETFHKWCADMGFETSALSSAEDYLDHIERSHSRHAVRHAGRAIKAYGRFHAEFYEMSNPFARLKLPKEPEVVHAPMATEDDLTKLLAACTNSNGVGARSWEALRDRAIILVLAHTGMRRGEVARMTLDDLNLVEGTVRVPMTKTKVPREPWLHPDAVAAIMRYIRASDADRPEGTRALWMGTKSLEPLAANGIGQMLYRRRNAAGVSVAAHAFRRKQASDWMAKGGSETGLMTNNGWSSTAMIRRYTKATAEANAQAEARRLFDPN